MSGRHGNQNSKKEKGTRINCKTNQEVITDEIDLRDEILELKRQVLTLKRANEQNLIKLRKYESDAKRKDRQIEHLMDPRKNAEITRILSTKGAAILMTLKDQNNALVQMILNKDIQIRKLMAEIKISKLYSKTKHGGPYKTEILHLRNLLLKAQQSMKETNDKEHQNQTNINCDNESISDTIISSNQSTPRDLEEMRRTIQSLEEHIKYSNDLLVKKSEEIINLTAEVQALKYDCDIRNKPFDCKKQISNDSNNNQNFDVSTLEQENLTTNDETPMKLSRNDAHLLELFEKTLRIPEIERTPNSVPPSASKTMSPIDSIQELQFQSNGFGTDIEIKENTQGSKTERTNNLRNNKISTDTSTVLNEDKLHLTKFCSNSDPVLNQSVIQTRATENWIKAFEKHKFLKRKEINNPGLKKESQKTQKEIIEKQRLIKVNQLSTKRKSQIHSPEKGNKLMVHLDETNWVPEVKNSEKEQSSTEKFLMENNGSQEILPEHLKSFIDIENKEKTNKTFNIRSVKSVLFNKTGINTSDEGKITPLQIDNSCLPAYYDNENSNSSSEMCQNKIKTSSNICVLNDSSINNKEISESDTSHIKKEICKIVSNFSPEIQKELRTLYDNISAFEEREKQKSDLQFEPSLDSSFESRDEEAHIVQVEVEINSTSTPQRSRSLIKMQNFQTESFPKESVNLKQDGNLNSDDDDDVVVR